MRWNSNGAVEKSLDLDKFVGPRAEGEDEQLVAEGLRSAIEAAKAIIDSGALGKSGPWNVGLSGSANAGHKASKDSEQAITIQITRVRK